MDHWTTSLNFWKIIVPHSYELHSHLEVQLTHETLRSFLLRKVETLTIDENKLHETFTIDETEANGNVTLICIRTLSDISPKSKHFQRYAANFWVDHLSNATSMKCYNDLLVPLHQFFISDALQVWIRAGLRKIPRYEIDELDVHVEEKYVSKIKEWLGKASKVREIEARCPKHDLKCA